MWVDMGLGKTVSTLTAVADLIYTFEVHRVLVIAPLRVAHTTWPDEVARWDHIANLSLEVIKGGPAARAALISSDKSDIHVINRELVPWLVEHLRDRRAGWPYDMVVIDEASSFKSHRTRRWKALRKALPAINRLVQLTGTPASNGLLDVWPQVFLLDRGERLGKTFTGFRSRHFESDYMGYTWTPKKGADREIYAKLEDICLTLSAADYLDYSGFSCQGFWP